MTKSAKKTQDPDPKPDAKNKPGALPASGGSFMRGEDGKLEPRNATPAAKPAPNRQPKKDV